MTMTQLIANNLTKSYRKRIVVDDVSLNVAPGEIVGLLGPNGAGKTTCFYLIVGLVRYETGEIILGDETISRYPMHARARCGLGYLPQEASIFRKLSVTDNIMGVLQTRKDLSAKKRKQKLDKLLDDLSIGRLRDNTGISLSGGERRRVEFARALALEPKFILLDEPFAGVDPISVGDIQRIIQYLAQEGIGVLITDHSVRETLGICHRAYILSDGKILESGLPEKILKNQQVRDVYLGQEFTL
ncbi:Lipopolysaccharide ABC transporter, ATP-binding protein LptB [hydrothermal vent metagenome]|uniref:Lipopolysaccharide ABC transporter, ATP-binding protein LptB n=1 Tax=hydrothermal vent metagenome TaxID=652676 RepID=A0A3B0YTD2_9ZZZZ